MKKTKTSKTKKRFQLFNPRKDALLSHWQIWDTEKKEFVKNGYGKVFSVDLWRAKEIMRCRNYLDKLTSIRMFKGYL